MSFISFYFFSAFAQKSVLQSGPMLGYSEMKEVLLWVQTNQAATVQFDYWNIEKPNDRFSTPAKLTTARDAFTAKLLATQIEPGQTYGYQHKINNQAVEFDYPTTFQSQALWQWRNDPPNFTIALGSCAYINETQYDRPGKPYGSNYQIFESIHKKQPDAMLWLGDNTYLREVDWFTRSGIHHRYTHTRSLPEMQSLLASTHHYAIWDDHDFGPNDADRSFIHKDKTLEAFKLFWGNPTFGLPDQKGTTSFFKWSDIDFFMLDNRYHRSPNHRITTKAQILGKEQLEWLVDALTFSRAPFKMIAVGGQLLNSAESYENHAALAPQEKAYLLDRIAEEGITGVVFLNGDRHKTELSSMTNRNKHTIYDLTVSPLTSGANTWPEDNRFRVEGTEVQKHNFAILEFSGPRKDRKMTIKVYDANGVELWIKEIGKSDIIPEKK